MGVNLSRRNKRSRFASSDLGSAYPRLQLSRGKPRSAKFSLGATNRKRHFRKNPRHRCQVAISANRWPDHVRLLLHIPWSTHRQFWSSLRRWLRACLQLDHVNRWCRARLLARSAFLARLLVSNRRYSAAAGSRQVEGSRGSYSDCIQPGTPALRRRTQFGHEKSGGHRVMNRRYSLGRKSPASMRGRLGS